MKCYKKGYMFSPFDVPKRYFQHFYVFGTFTNVLVWLVVVLHPFSFTPLVPPGIRNMLACSSPSGPVDNLSTALVLSCITVHVCRRCIESSRVSSYSAATMSLLHYVAGILHYFSLPVIPLLESRLVCTNNSGLVVRHISECRILHVFGLVVFVVSSWKQNQLLNILSNLRRQKDNRIKNTEYYIPKGDLFQLVSCPHFLMEILIHLSFSIMSSFSNVPLLALLTFVITNQVIAALLNHKWYRTMVPSYPTQRTAIIPFLL
ncbi:polyprenol reductase-like isoform X1 [Argonauta hians]